MVERIDLIHPTADLCDDFRALAAEFSAEGDHRYRDAARDVPAFVEMCRDQAAGRSLPADWAPQTTFWLVRGGRTILGSCRLRHRLTEFLAGRGGHIGYDVRPSERRKGYGTRLLQLTLPEARKIGLTRVLITADDSNVASWRIIERNGGQREPGRFVSESGALRRYWLMTDYIRFDDGAAYERYMGTWSQRVGDTFLEWLAPQSGLRWLDVGCGNGAFTEMLVERCAPVSVQGIDPSEPQLAFARTRPASRVAEFRQGDAMALPFPDDTFDTAVMPLVIFFVPDPATGVAEMARVVCPGGAVTAYAWDMVGDGFPYASLQAEMRGLGVAVSVPPSPDASRIDAMRDLWTGAGLDAVETREITVQRTFADFEDYWTTVLGGASVGPKLAAMASEDLARLKERMRARLPADSTGRITYSARANAVKGRV